MSGLLAAGLVTAVVATGLALGHRPRLSRPGRFPDTRRTTFAVVGALALAFLGGVTALVQTGGHLRRAEETFALLLIACLVWLPATRRWNARSHLCWSCTVFLFATYLVFMLRWTFHSPLSGWALSGALLLWVLEAVTALLGCAYLWEMCDALGSEHWPRRSRDGAPAAPHRPFVSLHVPAHDEPPELVIATVRSLLNLDYDRYEVIVIVTTPRTRRCGGPSSPGAASTASRSPISRTGPGTSRAPSTTPCAS